MTTDDFAEAARAYAEQACYQDENIPIAEAGYRAGWKAARAHLAAQGPTDDEVLAALNADYAIRFGPRNLPADSLEQYGDEAVRIMRAALSAARRDEKGKP